MKTRHVAASTFIIGLCIGSFVALFIQPKSENASSRAQPLQARARQSGAPQTQVETNNDQAEHLLAKGALIYSSQNIRTIRDHFKELAKTSSVEALSKAKEFKGAVKTEVLLGIIEGWLEVDSSSCIKWINESNEIYTSGNKGLFFAEVSRYLANSRPLDEGVAILNRSLGASEASDSIFREFFYTYGTNHGPIPLDTFNKIENQDARKDAIRGLMVALTEKNPQIGMQFFLQAAKTDDADIALRQLLVTTGSESGALAAIELIKNNEASLSDRQIDNAFATVAVTLTTTSPPEAVKMISAINDNKRRDNLIKAEAAVNTRLNPEFTLQMLPLVSDDKLAIKLAYDAYSILKKENPERVQEMIKDNSRIGEAQKAALLKRLNLSKDSK